VSGALTLGLRTMLGPVGVGGPRLDVGGGGWDLWPVVGAVLVLWIGRRVLGISWGIPLLIAAGVGALAVPITVHAWGVVGTSAVALAATLVAWFARRRGSAKGNSTV
jgi:hypothetical protein